MVCAYDISQVAEVDSGGCVLSGYLIQVLVLEAKIFIYSYLFLLQYFFLAFFFCLNAIAINTYLPFSMISATFQKVQQNLNISKVSWGPCEYVCDEK